MNLLLYFENLMKFYKLFLFPILLFGSSINNALATDVNSSNKNQVLFDQYKIDVSKEPIQIPSGYTYKGDMWVDELGKRVDPVKINFAGQYYLGLHSCGAGCRYYTLNNLENKQDLSALLDQFTSNPDEGKNTFIQLFYQKNSRLLIARYFKNDTFKEYHDCQFLLKNNKLESIEKCSRTPK